MPKSRKECFDVKKSRFVHCISRCVRQQFLCGIDPVTNKNYEHRKQIIVDKIKTVSQNFAIDVCSYAIMSNHYHLVLKINISKLTSYTEDEIIRHWTAVFPSKEKMRQLMIYKEQQNKKEAKKIINCWRKRLISISWFMAAINQSVAKRANKEDQCKGRFWDGRFVSQQLVGDPSILKCMASIRAGAAKSLTEKTYTSIYERLQTLKSSINKILKIKNLEPNNRANDSSIKSTLSNYQPKWLIKFSDNKGEFISALQYITFVEKIGRELRAEGKGFIKPQIPTISSILKISTTRWYKLIQVNSKEFNDTIKNDTLRLKPIF